MVKWLAILLFIVTAVSTFVPCCIEDGCAKNLSLNTGNHRQQHEDKGSCSPLFACGTCAPAVLLASPPMLPIPELSIEKGQPGFISFSLSTYHNPLFQPPRLRC